MSPSRAEFDTPLRAEVFTPERKYKHDFQTRRRVAARRKRDRERRALLGVDARVPADIVRHHLQRLCRDAGMTQKQIAQAAGVTEWTIRMSMHGRSKYHPYEVGHAVLSVSPTERNEEGPSWRLVPAVGTRRRLEGLTDAGWGLTALSEALGVPQSTVQRLYGQRMVTTRVADAVRRLTESGRQPPASTSAQKRAATLARQKASRLNYVPLRKWDNIDDPKEVRVRRGRG